ncbi:hypothetical protein H9P43_009222 [Blastocladiella emersonii ATCC 22665]|nr:hypothetical protein H9P43_009222 [Blastocladiella emersonii ATCC 22665]
MSSAPEVTVAPVAAAAPAPAAVAATTTTTTTTTTKPAKAADLVRDKDVKHLCCGCMEIRRGVITLLVVSIVMNALAAILMLVALSFAKSSARAAHETTSSFTFRSSNGTVQTLPDHSDDALNAIVDTAVTIIYVALGVTAVQILFTAWGLSTVIQRKVANFKTFTIINIVLLIVSAAVTLFSGNFSSILSIALQAYFAYVFFSYVDTMRAEKEALKEIELKATSNA